MYNDNLLNLIKDKFHECLKEGVSFKPVYHPNIPAKQEEKARKHFVETKDAGETVLMLFDTSLFAKGKNGLALTDRAVYFKDMFGGTKRVAYDGWRIDADDSAALLNITEENAFLLAPFLTRLLNDICTMKRYEGLFDAEKGEEEAHRAEEARREEEARRAEEAKQDEAQKKEKVNSEEDDDENDDDDVGLLDILGVVMDVTSDPSRE